jgi:putative molybdopterin biosynthesis protein
MAIDHEILTVKEVCGILQIDKFTVYKLIKEGRLPAFKIGTDRRVQRAGTMRWLAEQTNGTPVKEKSSSRDQYLIQPWSPF